MKKKFIYEKVASRRQRKTKDATEFNHHQILLLIERFHYDIKTGLEYIYVRVVISYGIYRHLVFVNLLITSVQRILLIVV